MVGVASIVKEVWKMIIAWWGIVRWNFAQKFLQVSLITISFTVA